MQSEAMKQEEIEALVQAHLSAERAIAERRLAEPE
jgi:(2Fe-2S) ferredoxin